MSSLLHTPDTNSRPYVIRFNNVAALWQVSRALLPNIMMTFKKAPTVTPHMADVSSCAVDIIRYYLHPHFPLK